MTCCWARTPISRAVYSLAMLKEEIPSKTTPMDSLARQIPAINSWWRDLAFHHSEGSSEGTLLMQ